MTMPQVGDTVEIVDIGETYSMYYEWAERYNLNKFKFKSQPEHMFGVVVVVGRHLTSSKEILVGVEIDDQHFIINSDGVKIVTDKSKYHPHHDLIVAWAKGAKIQRYDSFTDKWYNVPNPNWGDNLKYRLKPTTTKDLQIEELESTIQKAKEQIEKLKGCVCD